MSRIVFLLEERSMKELLDGLLPRLFPGLPFLCVPHEGKQDLERSIGIKLRAWREPGVQFCIVRDQDLGDCHPVKERLLEICRAAGRDDAVVRLACRELESWYFGAPDVLAEVYGNKSLRGLAQKRRYRDPDAIDRPAEVLRREVPEFQKVSGARRMGRALERENHSRSFQVLLEGVSRLQTRLDSEDVG